MVSVDRDGFGGMCGVLLPCGEGLERVRRVAGGERELQIVCK